MEMVVPRDDENWPSLGRLVCEFIEQNLVFGPGDLRGEPAKLDKEKRALVWRMYEIYPEGHEKAGRRRFKRAALSLPKGTGKTEFAAWIAACELHPEAPVRCAGFKDGEPIGEPVRDPYIPIIAYTEEQSEDLCYGTLRVVLEEGPLRDDFDIGLTRIMRHGGDGKAVPLAGNPNARDGARTTFSVFDETHWWTLDRLKQAHQTMMANLPKRKKAQPWALEVTTAPEPGAGSVAEDTMEYAKALDEGRAKDSRMFFFHRQASDDHDLDTEEGARTAVIEASGPAAEWRDIDGIVELWRDPTTDRRYWERVWCNRLVQSGQRAFDLDAWKALEGESPVQDGDLIVLGFDGAQFHDAVSLVGCHVETGFIWPLGIWQQPYSADDWQAPVNDIDDTVDMAFETWDVWRMYADPPYWQSWTSQWAGRYGDKKVIEWWTNRNKAMAYALRSFSDAIAEGTISHDGNEHLTRHIGNAQRHETNRRDDEGKPLWLIRKERPESPKKIDAAMAAVLAWEARNDAIAAGAQKTTSVYEERGIRTV